MSRGTSPASPKRGGTFRSPSSAGATAEVPIFDVMRRRLTLTGSTLRPRSIEFKTMVADEIAKTVWPYVEGGRLKPVIDSSFPLAEAAAAHARMEEGEHVGKIVLDVAQ
jgi:NADPH:quinone reductase-like Zn-dependent oxidoreductase